jgi:hypothetical protein
MPGHEGEPAPPQFVLPLDQQSPEPSGVSEYHQFAKE